MKVTTVSTLGTVSLAFLLLACGNTTTANNSAAANAAGKSNTAAPVNSDRKAASTPTPAATTTPTPDAQSEAETIRGQLQAGKTESVILYFGEESGDYAGYCFTNDSDAGRTIMGACKNGEQCEVVAAIDGEAGCKVPGLEADLSASGRIMKVESAKSLGRKK